jgi:hypothetical protein
MYLLAAKGDYLRFCIGGIMKSAGLVGAAAAKAWSLIVRA